VDLVVLAKRSKPAIEGRAVAAVDHHPGFERCRRPVELPVERRERYVVIVGRSDVRTVVLLDIEGEIDHGLVYHS